MHKAVVSITAPRYARKCSCHPDVEHVMHEKVSQDGAYDALNAKVTFARAGLSTGGRGRLEAASCHCRLRAGGGSGALSAGRGRGSLGAIWRSTSDGNRVPDDDRVVDHEHFFDEQPDYPLAFRDIQRISRFA